jgi:hypothetical protein
MTVDAAVVSILTPEQWERQRFSLLRFVRRHGERRITGAAWRRLAARGFGGSRNGGGRRNIRIRRQHARNSRHSCSSGFSGREVILHVF